MFFIFAFSNFKSESVCLIQIHFSNSFQRDNLCELDPGKKANIMSNCLKQCIRVLSKSNLMSQKSSASSSTLFGHCLSTNLAGIVPAVSVLHNQHQFFSTTSCRLKKGMGPNKQAMLQIKDQRLRIRDIPVEVAKLYMESEAYKQAYGDFKVKNTIKNLFGIHNRALKLLR